MGNSQFGDKYIMSKKITNPLVYFFGFGWLAALLDCCWLRGLALCSVSKILDFDIYNEFGVCFGGLPYLMAMKIEEPTRINVWWNLIPIFTLIGEWFIFHQMLSVGQLAAFAILITGAFVASIHAGKEIRRVASRAFDDFVLRRVLGLRNDF